VFHPSARPECQNPGWLQLDGAGAVMETDGSLRLSPSGPSLANDCRSGSNRSAHDVRDQVCQ
jgi:hypothetical protein